MSRHFSSATTDVISAGNHATLQPGSVTICGWFNPGSNSSAQTSYALMINLYNTAESQGIYSISTSGIGPHLAYYFLNGTSKIDPGTFTMTANTWFHVAATFSSASGLKAFVNGISEGSAATANTLGTSSMPTTIGAGLGASGGAFEGWNGSAAEVGIWNTPLTTAEVKALSAGALPYTIRQGSLVGYWPLNGIASPEPDFSGNAFNGTVTGATPSAGPPVMQFTPRWPQFIPGAVAFANPVVNTMGYSWMPNVMIGY